MKGSKVFRILAVLGIVAMAGAGALLPSVRPAEASTQTYTGTFTATTTGARAFLTAASWSSLWGSAGNGVTIGMIEISSDSTSNTWHALIRGQLKFDTSSIPSNAVISSASVSLYGESKGDYLGIASTYALGIFSSTSTSATVVQADYQASGTTLLSNNVTYSAWVDSTSTPNVLTFNAAGLAAINKGGLTTFSVRDVMYDGGNVAPTWSASNPTSIQYYEGASYSPSLTVNYVIPPTVTTSAAADVGDYVAQLSGNVTALGSGASITQRGWQWGTSSGIYTANWTQTGTYSTGAYSQNVTGFSSNTTYYFRAMAFNGDIWGYGSEQSFTTYLVNTTQWPSSAVTDTTYSFGIGDSPQHHVYRAAGRWWVFYPEYLQPNGSDLDIYVLTSVDGLTGWTKVALGLCNGGDSSTWWDDSNEISTAYDGTYFHIAWQDTMHRLNYRRGTFNSNGTVTWSAATQTVATGLAGYASVNGNNPDGLAVDSSGHAFISYETAMPGGHTYVTEDANTDGTWSTAAGFPYMLNHPDTTGPVKANLVPLGGANIYVVYVNWGGNINHPTQVYGQLWNGSSWGTQENSVTSYTPDRSTTTHPWFAMSLTSHSGIVELVYLDTAFNIRCATRSATGTWTDIATIPTTLNGYSMPLVSLWGSSDLRVFYTYNNGLYRFGRTNGAWDASPILAADETARTMFEPNYELSISYDSAGVAGQSNQIGIAYIVGTGPYDVRFYVLSDLLITTDAATNLTTSSVTLNGTLVGISGAGASSLGFKWSIGDPTYYQYSWSENGTFGVGPFSYTVTGLYPGESIYYQAFGVNVVSTAFGGQLSSVTTVIAPIDPYHQSMSVTSSTTYPQLAVLFSSPNGQLAAHGYFGSSTRDVDVMNGSTPLPRMVTDTVTAFTVPITVLTTTSLGVNLNYTSGQTPTNLQIVTGQGGYVTTTENAALEPGSNFQLDVGCWTGLSSENITIKASAFSLTATASNVTAAITSGATVTAANPTAGYHAIRVIDNGTTLNLYIDNMTAPAATTSTGSMAVPSNSNVWTWLQGVPYANYIKLQVGTTRVLWYEPRTMITGTDIVDRMGNQDGAVTWGSNPAAISIVLSALQGTSAVTLTGATSNATGNFLPIPDMPPTMYTEGDVSAFPFGEAVNEVLAVSNTPPMLWWYPFIFWGIAILAMLVYELTQSTGGEGSLLLMDIVIEAGLVLFGMLGQNGATSLIPFWPAMLFPVPAVAILLSKRHIGWG